MKKILINGLAAGVVMLVAAFVLGRLEKLLLPAFMMEYQNPGLFRSETDPLMLFYFAHPFVLGLAMAFIWGKVKGLIQGAPMKRATHFALGYFIISTIPGMLISYSSFPLSIALILSWTVSSFVQAWCAGLVLAKMDS